MPRPGYIICASSGAIDGKTNRSSMFDLLEAIVVHPKKLSLSPPTTAASEPDLQVSADILKALFEANTIRVLSVWVRDEGDTPEVVYESQLACVAPSGEDLLAIPSAQFFFTKPFHRLIARGVPLMLDYPAPGLYHFESRVRRQGETDWQHRQSYPYLVQHPEPAQTPDQDAPAPVAE